MKRAMVVLLCVAAAFAQQRSSTVWSFSATGTSSGIQADAHVHTIQVEPSGSPAACTVKLEGSLDGASWFDLSGSVTCTSATMLHVTDKPAMFVRANLTALSGHHGEHRILYDRAARWRLIDGRFEFEAV